MSSDEVKPRPSTRANTTKRIIALVLLVGSLGVVMYHCTAHHDLFAAFRQPGSDGRKVLYWYDSMNPQHHYDKPGKAPDGMDLVPAFADQAGPAAGAPGSSNSATNPRKVLYWFDAMNPQRHSDKPG